MDKNLAHKIFREASHKQNINITQMAREIDAPPSSLFHHMRGNRRWRIEDWLGTLFKLGAVEIGDNGAYIKSRELAKALRRLNC
jgi:hypothetical protein